MHDPDRRATPRQQAAASTSAPEATTASTLSAPIATEVSAFFTAKVPPKPQHWSAPAKSTRRRPSTAPSSRCGRSPMRSSLSEWQVGWNATACGNRAPTEVTPRSSTRNSLSSRTRGATASTAPGNAASPLSAATVAWWWRIIAAHDAEGVTTTSNPANASVNPRTSGTHAGR
jgi:hypothetical protein